MKRLQLFLAVIVIVSVSIWALKAQTKPKQPPKTYKVELTIEQWNGVLMGIENVKNRLKVSDMPAKEVTAINDSLLTLIQAEFTQQINVQLASEKPKKDSTSKKK